MNNYHKSTKATIIVTVFVHRFERTAITMTDDKQKFKSHQQSNVERPKCCLKGIYIYVFLFVLILLRFFKECIFRK